MSFTISGAGLVPVWQPTAGHPAASSAADKTKSPFDITPANLPAKKDSSSLGTAPTATLGLDTLSNQVSSLMSSINLMMRTLLQQLTAQQAQNMQTWSNAVSDDNSPSITPANNKTDDVKTEPGAPLPGTDGKPQYKAKASSYYPANTKLEGGFKDMRGKKLYTLQDYLEGNAPYVSVAMDNKNSFSYGTKLRIPELEKKYGRKIEFRVVDTGGAFYGKAKSRIDICTRSEATSLDPSVNGDLTLIPV